MPAGGPQISVEVGRFEVRMVREWSHVVSKVNWSRFGSGWSRLDTFLGRVLADFCHFWPFLAFLGAIFGKVTRECKISMDEGRVKVRMMR